MKSLNRLNNEAYTHIRNKQLKINQFTILFFFPIFTDCGSLLCVTETQLSKPISLNKNNFGKNQSFF